MANPPQQQQVALRRRRRRRRAGTSNGQQLTVRRTEFLGSLLPGNGGFNGQYLFVYPQETTVVNIARSYSEYRYSRYQVRIIPRAATSTLGTHFGGFLYTAPVAITQLSHASALGSFGVQQSYGRNVITRLDRRARRQNWFPMLQTDLTDAQSVSPDIVQAWLFTGTQSVQSGVTTGDIHVSYTLQLRGPRAIDGGALLTAVGRPLQATPNPQGEEDEAGDTSAEE